MKEKDLENAFPVIFPLTFLYVSRPDHQAKFLSFLRMLKNWSTLHETVKNHLLIFKFYASTYMCMYIFHLICMSIVYVSIISIHLSTVSIHQSIYIIFLSDHIPSISIYHFYIFIYHLFISIYHLYPSIYNLYLPIHHLYPSIYNLSTYPSPLSVYI